MTFVCPPLQVAERRYPVMTPESAFDEFEASQLQRWSTMTDILFGEAIRRLTLQSALEYCAASKLGGLARAASVRRQIRRWKQSTERIICAFRM